MTFKSSANCSKLHLRPDYSNKGLKYRYHDTIEFGFSWVRSYNSGRYLFVPEKCFLYLTDLELYEVQNRPVSINELKYSHRNNRPPELIGLTSSVVENLNSGFYIDSLSLIPPLPLTSYTTTTAEFTFTPADTDHYVIPQDSHLVLWSSKDQPRNTFRRTDTVKIRFRRMDDENCSIPEIARRGVKLRELENELEFEVEYHKDVLANDGARELRMPVSPDCELRLLHFSLELRMTNNPWWVNVVQYSMTPLLAEQTHVDIRDVSSTISFPAAIRSANYLECLSDFPPFEVIGKAAGISGRFRSKKEDDGVRYFPHCEYYLLPPDVPIVMHKVVKNARLKSDVVKMVFEAKTEDCRLKFVGQEDNEAWSITWVNNGRKDSKCHV